MAKSPIISITSLQGGLNDSDPAPAIADDQVTVADNVEFFLSPLGERRLGCNPVDVGTSGLDLKTLIVFIGLHNPSSTEVINSELWVVGVTLGLSILVARRSGTTWYPVTIADTLSSDSNIIGHINAASLHGKFFFACKSNKDRLHVWDGVTFRRAGLAAPAVAPSTAETAGAGTFADNRTYRVRFTVQDASAVTILRSEPSPEFPHTTSGTKTGVIVTRPAVVDGNETHWELEASSGDGNFYVIATTAIATTTATDTTTPATGYGAFDLSEDIGDYELIPSVKFVVADQDRLVFGGSWEDSDLGSRVSWTPVFGATGVGNDERIPLDTNNFIDLDWMSDGNLTGLSTPVNGSLYAFKMSKVYKLQRSGDVDAAYTAFQISGKRGALEGSIVNGADEHGGPCVYFLDPAIGPCRISAAGLQEMKGIRGTWKSVNTSASPIASHGIYYPDKQQVHWWVAHSGSTTPNKKIICQVSELRDEANGAGTERGWSLADGDIATAYCSAVVPEKVTDAATGDLRISFRPYIGRLNPDGLLRCDVGVTDNGSAYVARIVTKPFMAAGLLDKWGVMAASLLAEADVTTLKVSLIRDFGLETNTVTTTLSPTSTEDTVNKRLDNLRMSDATAIQVQFMDP
jgi:hypothetical protein